MQLVRIVFASVLLFGVGCMVPDEGGPVDQAMLDESIDGESEMVAYDSEVTSEAVQGDEDLLGDDKKEKWICLACKKKHHKDGGDECPDKYCYHAKHPHKDKAKEKALKVCEKEHEHCQIKDCWKSDHH